MTSTHHYDIAVIGAGVFGAWTALQLHNSGARVVLVDAYGPGNSRASSGGESRIMRLGYGPDEIYTSMAQRSLRLWQEFFDRIEQPKLFQPTGVLWLAKETDAYCDATLETLRRRKVELVVLERDELARRYPQLEPGTVTWAILEVDSGVLMARQAVKAVVSEARKVGVTYFEEAVLPPDAAIEGHAKLNSVETLSGRKISAAKFVFACGPWLPKLFPTLLSELIHVTRQEVFFFGTSPGDERFGPAFMPAWIDFNDLVYGVPNLEDRGFKLAIDAHGPKFDPDTGERIVTGEGLAAARAYLTQRMPLLRDAPLIESRVCQYENTSNGDFLIDLHPDWDNVWLVGGGSGHGFKHGPAVGEYVMGLVSGHAEVEPRFSLASKEQTHHRSVY